MTTDPSREAKTYEDRAWYWVEREVWADEPSRIAPAMYKANCDAWYSYEFSGISTRFLKVLEPCLQQAAMAHKELERWIPVTERLPQDGQQVWVIMQWAAEKASHDYSNQGYAIWSDGDWFFDLTESGDLYSRQQAIKDNLDAAEIAAWMSLPAAPLPHDDTIDT